MWIFCSLISFLSGWDKNRQGKQRQRKREIYTERDIERQGDRRGAGQREREGERDRDRDPYLGVGEEKEGERERDRERETYTHT